MGKQHKEEVSSSLGFTNSTDLLPLVKHTECEENSLIGDKYPYWSTFVAKMDMVMFEGNDHRTWIIECKRYLQVHGVMDDEKVERASLFLSGEAENWYLKWCWGSGRRVIRWEEFETSLCDRFENVLIDEAVEHTCPFKQEEIGIAREIGDRDGERSCCDGGE